MFSFGPYNFVPRALILLKFKTQLDISNKIRNENVQINS